MLSSNLGEMTSALCEDSEKSGIILMTGCKTTACYFKQLIIEVVTNEHPATCGGVYGSFLPCDSGLHSALFHRQLYSLQADRQQRNAVVFSASSVKHSSPSQMRMCVKEW